MGIKYLTTIRQVIKKHSDMAKGALFAAFSFVNKAFNFLLLLILANYIAPVEYGYLSLFMTVVMIVGYFMAFSTEGYFSIAFFDEGINGSKKAFSGISYISLTVLIFLLLLFFVASKPLSGLLSLPSYTILFGVLSVYFSIYLNTLLEYYRINDKVYVYGIISCSNALLNFVLSILLVKNFHMGWEGRVYSITCCSFVYGLLGIFFFVKKRYYTKTDWSYIKKMLFWGIPIIPHLAANFLKQGCDRYIINFYHSTEDVGIFSFALTLTTIITMIGFGFNQSNSVTIYKVCGDHSLLSSIKRSILSNQRKKYLYLYLICSIIAVVLCITIIPLLLPKYNDSMKYVPILGVYGLMVCYYLIYTNYLFFYKKTKTLMYITFGSALLHLFLSLAFTRYSLIYTSIIYCISQSIVVYFVRRVALNALEDNLNKDICQE